MTPHDLESGMAQAFASGTRHLSAPFDGPDDALLADIPVPLCRVNAHGQILQANALAAQLLSTSQSLLNTQSLQDLAADDVARQQLINMRQHFGHFSGEASMRRIRLRSQDRVLHVDLKYRPLRATHQNITPQWLVALIDQTPHQQEHEALSLMMKALREAHDTNHELAVVADRSPNMIFICDADRRIRWVNPSFTRITGYSLAESIGQSPLRLFRTPQPDSRLLKTLDSKLGKGEAIDRITLQTLRKDGTTYWAQLAIQPVLDEQGRIVRHITIGQDITDQLQAQTEREALVRAEASHAIKSEFLSRMSHNMRTPLNAVLGFSQLLSLSNDPGLDSGHKQKLDIIHKAGKQLLSLVDQALQLAQLEHHAEPCEARRVDLLPMLTDAVDMLKERASAQHLNILIEATPCAAWADAQRVREVVHNLLSNAIKYSQPHRTIWLRCGVQTHHPAQVFIEVQDQGVGISADALPLLFQPFTRLETTRAMASGHGLGLAISRRQAQLMHGDITVDSEAGQGSTFRLVLPADMNHSVTPLLESNELRPDQFAHELPAMRLVYVEDNPMNRALVESVLHAFPQIDVTLAATVVEGMAAIENRAPDVVLLDINLPDGTGLDICRWIRSRPRHPQPLLIALSADALPQHITAAMEAGFDEYLVKPLQIHRLLEMLSSATQVRLSMPPKH